MESTEVGRRDCSPQEDADAAPDFEILYAIAQVFAASDDVVSALPSVLALLDRVLPLKSSVLVRCSADRAPQTTFWSTTDPGPEARGFVEFHARLACAYLGGSGTTSIAATPAPQWSGVPRTNDGSNAPQPMARPHLIALPLVAKDGAMMGVLQVEGRERPDEVMLALVVRIAGQLATALAQSERVRQWADRADRAEAEVRVERLARVQAEFEQRRLTFLQAATRRLGASLDLRDTLGQLTSLMIPRFADYCLIDLAAGQHRLHRARTRSTWRSSRSPRAARVLMGLRARTLVVGQPVHGSSSLAHESPDVLGGLGIHSSLCLPLRDGAMIVGAVTLLAARPDRYRDVGVVPLLVELAALATRAIRHAQQYRARRAATRRRTGRKERETRSTVPLGPGSPRASSDSAAPRE